MDLVEHLLRIGSVRRVLRAERIEETLVLARGQQAAFDADLVHQAIEAEAVHQHADAADDAGLVDIDVVRSGRDVVGRRGTGLLDHRIDRLAVQLLEAMDLVVDDAGLHRGCRRAS